MPLKHPSSPSPSHFPSTSHFQDTPWALNLFSDPTLTPYENSSRVRKEEGKTADSFLSRTLNTRDTICGWQSFVREEKSGVEEGEGQSGRREVVTVIRIGDGVCGHVDICHGGFVGVLLDEIIGSAAELERDGRSSMMTASLKIDYKKPIRTPGVILCRSWVEKKEGRKLWGRGTIEDGEGGVLATGEALFLTIAREKVGLAKI